MFCKKTGKSGLLSNTGNASGQTWHKVVLLVREQQNDVHKNYRTTLPQMGK